MINQAFRSLTAADIMTREILPAYDSWDIVTLAEFLVANGISGAPVIDEEGNLRGVVSVTDIARFTVEGDTTDERQHAHQYYTDRILFEDDELDEGIEVREEEGACVANIMTPMVYSISEDTPLDEVCRSMVTNRIHRVFVSQEGRITGLISALDILATVGGEKV